jgi:Fe-S-cluster containining protein
MVVSEILSGESIRERLRQAVDEALFFADQTHQPFANNPALACKKGCSWCCRFQVSVTAPEIFRIADYVRENFSAEQLAALQARLGQVVGQTRGMESQTRALSGVSCALLVDDACSVYPVRPLICRGYNSTDAGVCEEATSKAGVKILCYATQRAIYDGTASGLIDGLSRVGCAGETYDLCGALLIVLQEPKTVEDWLAGKPVLAAALRRPIPDQAGRLSLL